jgi:hypothetical protein
MSISSSIYIDCPPSVVREKVSIIHSPPHTPFSNTPQFLDFPALPTYHKNFFVSITPLGPLTPSQKLSVQFASMGTMQPTIIANTPERFAWEGSLPLVFSGMHSFIFEVSGSGTKFTQTEVFGGALGWVMGEGWIANKAGMREKTMRGWEGFNADFKGWCEGGKGNGS